MNFNDILAALQNNFKVYWRDVNNRVIYDRNQLYIASNEGEYILETVLTEQQTLECYMIF